ncbi:hypothetical protein OIU77_003690 [Salix suchowensis]|uniref:Uncharacterized protein n=1 Tax=Salix suchowensis TaxID=1278906 RepID=A0ABQ8ZG02_9ROSI|nr:hypothetical protein OIU77_003690 [Salix suchowensis]
MHNTKEPPVTEPMATTKGIPTKKGLSGAGGQREETGGWRGLVQCYKKISHDKVTVGERGKDKSSLETQVPEPMVTPMIVPTQGQQPVETQECTKDIETLTCVPTREVTHLRQDESATQLRQDESATQQSQNESSSNLSHTESRVREPQEKLPKAAKGKHIQIEGEEVNSVPKAPSEGHASTSQRSPPNYDLLEPAKGLYFEHHFGLSMDNM